MTVGVVQPVFHVNPWHFLAAAIWLAALQATSVGYKLAGVAGAVVGGMAIFLPSFILMLSILPVYERIKRHTWIKAALKGIAPAVIGMTALALIQLLPFAVVDAATLLIAVVSIGI